MLKAITLDIPSLGFHGDLEFSKGLNVITGESGTGKSLILEAISHVFGRKTQRFSKLDRYTISAIVDLPDDVISKLTGMGYDIDSPEVSVFISKKERTIYRLNGILMTWASVSSILGPLISLVSVDERQSLKKESFRLQLIDRFVDKKLLSEIALVYNKYEKLQEVIAASEVNFSLLTERLERLKLLENEFKEVADYLDRYEDMLKLADKLKQAENILEKAYKIKNILKNNEDSVWNLMVSVESLLSALSIDIDVDCVYDIISEITDSVENIIAEYEYPEMSLDELEHIIWKIQRLMRKYDTDIEGLKQMVTQIEEVDVTLRQKRAEIDKLREEAKQLEDKYISLSKIITSRRKEAVDTIKQYLVQYSRDVLGGIVDIHLAQKDGFYPYGNDVVDFVFKVGKKTVPVYDIASSGELSRILLLLYTLVPPKQEVMVFDEIDAGTSGNVASKIAWFLKRLAENVQVITSTHSQFVAAAADMHFSVKDLGVRKEVKMLEGDHRIKEIARLIDGGSKGAYDVALELINSYKRGDMNG